MALVTSPENALAGVSLSGRLNLPAENRGFGPNPK
jgi:hypothetical protein